MNQECIRTAPGSCRSVGKFLIFLVLTIALLCSSAPLAEATARSNPHPGVELFQKHDFDAAAASFALDLKRNANDLTALIYLGRIAFEENRLAEAARYFEKATSVSAQSSEAFHWLGRVYGVQARDLGPPRGIGPARRTKKAFEKAVALDPNNLEARVELATYYREAPAIVGGSKRAALAQLQEITRRDPYLGALVKGDLALDEKTFDQAQRQYETAAQLEPKKSEAYFRLGVLHQRTRQFDKAFAAFEKMVELDPNDQRGYFQIGKTADLSGQQLARGEQALKRYLQSRPFFMMPKLSWAHRRLGNIYLKTGRRDAAREQYLAALKLAPEDQQAAKALHQLEASPQRP